MKKTLEAFSAKLRDETDIDRLGEDLAGVVGQTMQPPTYRFGCVPIQIRGSVEVVENHVAGARLPTPRTPLLGSRREMLDQALPQLPCTH